MVDVLDGLQSGLTPTFKFKTVFQPPRDGSSALGHSGEEAVQVEIESRTQHAVTLETESAFPVGEVWLIEPAMAVFRELRVRAERSLRSALTPILKVRLTNCHRTLILPGPWDPGPGIFEARLRE